MKLLKIKLTDFKGFTGEKSGTEIELFGRTLIKGKNGSGKTTIFDAHTWLFCDKDSSLKSNPNIRPNDVHECIPRVDEEWEVDGKILTISKMQKKKVSKPDAKGVSKITLTNSYEINAVPKTERDFKKDLTELGFDFDNFLPCSHIEVFTGNKSSDMRKVLFGMTSSRTDKEIAEVTEGCEEIAALLGMYKSEEIEAMNKASKKKADEQIEAIPNQIIGMEKSKVNIDVLGLETRRDELKRQIEYMESQLLSNNFSGEYDKAVDELAYLQRKLKAIHQKASEELRGKCAASKEKASDFDFKRRELFSQLRTLEAELRRSENDIKINSEDLKKAQKDYEAFRAREFDESKLRQIEAEEFDETSLICPECGQVRPEEQQSNLREVFEQSKKRRIEEQKKAKEYFDAETERLYIQITERGNLANKYLKSAQQTSKDVKDRIDKIQEAIKKISSEIAETELEMNRISESVVDVSGDPEYQDISKKIKEKETQIQSMEDPREIRRKRQSEIRAKREELAGIESQIAKAENDTRINMQIAELQKMKLEYAQKKADAERILNQLSLLGRAKNTLLESNINGWFNGARFKLYEYLKNGEYKETCILEIRDENGEWKTHGESANTALEMQGKLLVIAGIQKFYGVNYPVFMDFAAELDADTLSGILVRIRADLQVIFLRVTDGNLEIKELT